MVVELDINNFNGENSQNGENFSFDDFTLLIAQFIEKSEILSRVLDKETEYFKNNKMEQALKLYEHKAILVDELENMKTKISGNLVMLKNIPNGLKDSLRNITKKLRISSDENYLETFKAKQVNQLILEAVSDAIMGDKNENSAYSKLGKVSYKNNNFAPMTISESV